MIRRHRVTNRPTLPGGSELRIVALTARGMRAEHQRAFDAGCDDLIIKAVVKSEVIVVGATALVAPGGRHPTGPRAFAFPRFPLTTRLSAA